MFAITKPALPIDPPTLYFRSTLTHNGHRRPLPARIEAFLRYDGAILAAVLRSDTPLSLTDIALACQEYAAEYPETLWAESSVYEPHSTASAAAAAAALDEHTLPILLTRFVFWRLAEVVPPPRPTNHNYHLGGCS